MEHYSPAVQIKMFEQPVNGRGFPLPSYGLFIKELFLSVA